MNIPKYKAWFPLRKEMLDVESIEYKNGSVFVAAKTGFEKGGWYEWVTEDATRMTSIGNGEQFPRVRLLQYTGRHDEAGKELYAGDIVEIDGGPSVIKSEPGGFTISGLPLVEVSNYGMKIIGNIYKNPELLEDK